MKLCGIFMAYQRLCVSCFGAHQQPIQEQHGGTSSTVHSTLEFVFFGKMSLCLDQKQTFFSIFFVKWSQLHSLQKGDFSSSQKQLILAYGYCTGFPILVHCVVCSLALRKISFVSKKWLSS